jgi:hypothetical protein
MEIVFDDSDSRTVEASIALPEPMSTYARPKVRVGHSELWVACERSLVRVGIPQRAITGILDVVGSRDAAIADFAFDSSQRACAVCFERSGAVIAIDSERFQVVGVTKTAESLNQIALMDDGRFIARASDGPHFVLSSFQDQPV